MSGLTPKGDKTWAEFVDDLVIGGVDEPTGVVGGDLSGDLPDPQIVDDSHNHTAATLSGVVKTADTAGGDLSGPFSNLQVANDSHSHTATTVTAATASASGVSEMATAAETTTGTDDTRSVTPDGLAGSDFGKRIVSIQVTDPTGSALTTGDGKAYFTVPPVLTGMNLVAVSASLTTVSSSGLPTVQIANVTDTVDMLSTKVSIDATELTSYTAATAAVIDASKDDVVTGDLLRVDIDVAGTGAKGLQVVLTFQLP